MLVGANAGSSLRRTRGWWDVSDAASSAVLWAAERSGEAGRIGIAEFLSLPGLGFCVGLAWLPPGEAVFVAWVGVLRLRCLVAAIERSLCCCDRILCTND